VPPLGGFNARLLVLELRRVLRNRRTVFFAMVFPAALFLAFGGNQDSNQRVGEGNVSAYILVSMALYGAALTAASAGSQVAVERALGWSRQLRLTPLHPIAYVLVKAGTALAMGAGLVQGKPEMPTSVWIWSAVLALGCTLTFAALGVFVGYVVPGENAMQVLGPGLALLSFLGGVFMPLTEGSAVWHVAVFTPMYGVAEVARAPLTHELPWYAVVNAMAWFVVFVAGAAWRMSKDTARV
jgi:ABC-2 type transport system permease protein